MTCVGPLKTSEDQWRQTVYWFGFEFQLIAHKDNKSNISVARKVFRKSVVNLVVYAIGLEWFHHLVNLSIELLVIQTMKDTLFWRNAHTIRTIHTIAFNWIQFFRRKTRFCDETKCIIHFITSFLQPLVDCRALVGSHSTGLRLRLALRWDLISDWLTERWLQNMAEDTVRTLIDTNQLLTHYRLIGFESDSFAMICNPL